MAKDGLFKLGLFWCQCTKAANKKKNVMNTKKRHASSYGGPRDIVINLFQVPCPALVYQSAATVYISHYGCYCRYVVVNNNLNLMY
jgi:hypothetical protein